MLWTEKSCGAVQLCCNRAFRVRSLILLICRTESLIQFLVEESGGSAYLVTLTLNSVQIRCVDLRLGIVTDVVQQNEVALVFGSVRGSARDGVQPLT